MAPVNSDLRSFCQDGTQIFRSYLRDGIKHCPDASDEIGFAPPLLTETKIQDRYEEVLRRLESVEEKSTWTMLVEFLDRALPILNSVILFTCGGKKVHSRFKKQRARGQASPQVPAPVPSLIWDNSTSIYISLGGYSTPLSIYQKEIIWFLKSQKYSFICSENPVPFSADYYQFWLYCRVIDTFNRLYQFKTFNCDKQSPNQFLLSSNPSISWV